MAAEDRDDRRLGAISHDGRSRPTARNPEHRRLADPKHLGVRSPANPRKADHVTIEVDRRMRVGRFAGEPANPVIVLVHFAPHLVSSSTRQAAIVTSGNHPPRIVQSWTGSVLARHRPRSGQSSTSGYRSLSEPAARAALQRQSGVGETFPLFGKGDVGSPAALQRQSFSDEN
jgi:hypothetical protein